VAAQPRVSGEVPIERRYFEDYVPGSVHELGSFSISEAEIIEFAQRYDPQPIHIDPVAARQSIFGGLIASGWHTAALMMRLVVERYMSKVAALGSPGVDEIRWPKPVRPGDTLTVRTTVVDARRSRSKPDRGIVRSSFEVRNQHAELVMSAKGIGMYRCRLER
jgi:acyl dehydratase